MVLLICYLITSIYHLFIEIDLNLIIIIIELMRSHLELLLILFLLYFVTTKYLSTILVLMSFLNMVYLLLMLFIPSISLFTQQFYYSCYSNNPVIN
jgi:hypothetical protein